MPSFNPIQARIYSRLPISVRLHLCARERRRPLKKMDHEDVNGVLDFSPTQPPPAQPVGIYGWRKRCLYAFVLLLMIVVIMNLALTVWILRILRFSLDGMGHLKIVPNGIELKAEAEFLKTVYVKQLKSEGNPLFLESTKSVQLLATDNGKKVKSKLVVGT
ncbi:hypothetical protein Btru_059700 [Bulinus truncatus]|nr:hypothetical protein Btru_059700 [Bulinus truncatus]